MKVIAFLEERLNRLSEERFFFLALWLLMIVIASVMTMFAMELHGNFLTIACDTAAFQNTMVNILHGHWFRDTAYGGPNYLGLHCVLILVPLAWVYAAFPHVELLFALQIWGVYSSVFPLYYLGLDLLRKPALAFLVAASALATPFLLHTALAPFHPETWVLPAALWSYLAYRKNHQTGFWVSFIFALSCTEQAALIYMALGASWYLCDDGLAWRKKYGVLAFVTASAWLIFCTGFVIPQMRQPGQFNLLAYNYSNWGVTSIAGLTEAVFHQPLRALELMCDAERWRLVLVFIGPGLALALFSRRALILLTPLPVYFFMSGEVLAIAIHAYYFSFVFLAAYLGLLFCLSHMTNSGRLGFVLAGAILFINILLFFFNESTYMEMLPMLDSDFSATLHQEFNAIPLEAGVYGPHRYSAYLSNRVNMVMGDLRDQDLDFDAMVEAKFDLTTVHAAQIDYIVCDARTDQCGPRVVGPDDATAKRRAANLDRLVRSGEWMLQWSQGDVVILRRTGR